mmetsp:Transcript_16763/g.38788  ORF Transcript_16763/g.38788 Transcript_16763/m.38788 type:complete len:203 (-) Transcript_16763:4729-5337(-)
MLAPHARMTVLNPKGQIVLSATSLSQPPVASLKGLPSAQMTGSSGGGGGGEGAIAGLHCDMTGPRNGSSALEDELEGISILIAPTSLPPGLPLLAAPICPGCATTRPTCAFVADPPDVGLSARMAPTPESPLPPEADAVLLGCCEPCETMLPMPLPALLCFGSSTLAGTCLSCDCCSVPSKDEIGGWTKVVALNSKANGKQP